jgi:Lon protease-like protein
VSRVIRLFPLPEVVLLPGTLLPLHIFESRYRAMVDDSLEGDRLIGMAMLEPGWEEAGDAPRIHPVGGAGEIVESEKLPDGRYNILLEGRFRYRVLHEEDTPTPYRVASIEEIASIPFPTEEDEDRARNKAGSLFEALRSALDLSPMPQEPLASERFYSEMALRLRPPKTQALSKQIPTRHFAPQS